MGKWRAPQRVWHVGKGAGAAVVWDFAGATTVSDGDPDFGSLLEDFVSIGLGDLETAERFVRRWGAPGVCWSEEHPTGAHPFVTSLLGIARPLPKGRGRPLPAPPGWSAPGATGSAPLRWWQDAARRIAAALRLNADVEAGDGGEDDDWDAIWGATGVGAHPVWRRRPLDERRWVLGELMDRWLQEAHVHTGRPIFRGGTLVTPIDPRGVDGAVVRLLQDARERRDRPLVCSAPTCGRTFLSRTRRSKPGELRFCPRHNKREKARLSQRHRRESMTDAEREAQRAADAERMRERRRRRRSR